MIPDSHPIAHDRAPARNPIPGGGRARSMWTGLCAAVAALDPASAVPSVAATGEYQGRSGQALPLRFRVTGRHVDRIHFRVRLTCNGGRSLVADSPAVFARRRTALTRQGGFGLGSDNGARFFSIYGKVRRFEAYGQLIAEEVFRVDQQGQLHPDASGSLDCTGSGRWTARAK